ncbi:hypothetical protein TWF481_002653 [Arthrobotrys musiformis]|uniref:DUF6589 domain-containing protein n=1 Tax=Arthrobotrys musiformis TaxID=47236 RepID=A0AAV9VQT5_9PEZI
MNIFDELVGYIRQPEASVRVPDADNGQLSDSDGLDSSSGDSSDDPSENQTAKKRKQHRRGRNRSNFAVSAISILLYGRSRLFNRFQMSLGYFLTAQGTKKRCFSVLNQLGLTNAEPTVRKALKSTAESIKAHIQSRVAAGEPVDLGYDNIILQRGVGELSIVNKEEQERMTAPYLTFLHLDESVKAEVAAHRLDAAQANNIAIPRDILFRKADYSAYDPRQLLDSDVVEGYLKQTLRSLITRVFEDQFGSDVLRNRHVKSGQNDQRMAAPVIYKTQPRKPEAYSLPILDIDEGTPEGNGDVLDALVNDQLKLKPAQLVDAIVPVHADQGTTGHIRAIKHKRRRDHIDKRWLSDGRDPVSLSRFARILERNKLSTIVKKDYDGSHSFIEVVYQSLILTAAMRVVGKKQSQSSLSSLGELKSFISTNDWRDLVDEIINLYCPPRLVADLRAQAQARAPPCPTAPTRYDYPAGLNDREKAAFRKTYQQEAKAKYEMDVDANRDLIMETSILPIRDVSIYLDMDAA